MKIGRKKRSKKMSIGKLLIGVLIILVVIFVIVLLVNNKSEKEEKVDNEEEIIETREFEENPNIIDENKLYEEKVVEKYSFSNVNVEYKYNNTYFTVTVKNNGNDMVSSQKIVISFINQFGEKMHDFQAEIPVLKNGESSEIELVSIIDYSDVYDIEIKINE